MYCPACNFQNSATARFCQDCGAELTLVCGGCGASTAPGSRFCTECGQCLDATVAAPGAGGASPVDLSEAEGERKIITALFADIKGSMALLDGMDPDLASQIIDPTLRLMMASVRRFDGHISSLLGDGLFAIFGAPVPHEDHAQHAVYAALRMQDEIRAHAACITRDHGVPEIQLRIGINTGEMVLRSIQGEDGAPDYVTIGHATGIAARLESIATPGTILISENTRRLVSGYFELRSIGATPIRGVGEDVTLYEVLGFSRSRSRLEASGRLKPERFVGRASEFDQLVTMLDMARRGAGQIVGLVGEAGVGKSRLTYELKRMARSSGCRVLEGAAIAHGTTSNNFALIDMLESYFEIKSQDSDAARLANVRNRVLGLDPELASRIPFLLALLGVADPSAAIGQMDPMIRRQRTYDAIRSLILMEAKRQPVVLIIEDLHWLDGDSRGFLSQFACEIADAPVLLLVNYRPEHKPNWADSAGTFTKIRIGAFSAADADALLDLLLGMDPSLDQIKRLIVEKSEGNAFFIEEYVQSMFDQGILGRGPDVVLENEPVEMQIPTTVQGIIAARIGMLPPKDKAFLQLLAVLGMASPLDVIRHASGGSEAGTQEFLDRLVVGEFIQERAALPDAEYVFRHALTRETAYGELLADTKRTLHARAAEALREYHSERLGDCSSELAHHYACADKIVEAIEFRQLAAARAIQRSAYATAIRHLAVALELVPKLDDEALRRKTEMRLQAKIGSAQMATRGFAAPEVRSAYERAWALCTDATDTEDFVRVLGGIGTVYVNCGDLVAARQMGEELLSLAERRRETELFISAHDVLGMTLLRTGELVGSRRHFTLAIRHRRRSFSSELEVSLGRDPKSSSVAFGAMARWLQGYSDRALAHTQFAVKAAMRQSADRPFTVFHALLPLLWVHHFRREAAEAEVEARGAVRLAEQHGLPLWLAHCRLILGWALAEEGDTSAGLELIDKAARGYEGTGGVIWRPFYHSMHAEALAHAGALTDALGAIEAGLGLLPDLGPCWWEPELHRLSGALRLRVDPAEKARAAECFERAITVAERHGSAALELRARTDAYKLEPTASRAVDLGLLLERLPKGQSNQDCADARAALRAAQENSAAV